MTPLRGEKDPGFAARFRALQGNEGKPAAVWRPGQIADPIGQGTDLPCVAS